MLTPFSGYDILVGAVYSVFAIIIILLLSRYSKEQFVITLAFLLQLFGVVASCLYVIYIYGGGDALYYHKMGVAIADGLRLGDSPIPVISRFLSTGATSTDHTIALSGMVHYLCFNSFVAASLIFSLFGFAGRLLIYSTFRHYYPDPRLQRWWRLGILYMPSFVFWSSGILKDPIGLFGLACTFWGIHKFKCRMSYWSLGVCLAGGYLLLLFRIQFAYVAIISFLPWILGSSREAVPFIALVRALAKVAVMVSCLLAVPALSKVDHRIDLSDLSASFAVERSGYAGTVGGSTFEKTTVDDTSWSGVASRAPSSIVFTLYRPFIWEVRNPAQLLAALENAVLMLFSVRAFLHLLKGRVTLRRLAHSPLFVTSLVFSLVSTIALAESTPNLGTISRYRAPLIPFFVAILVISEYQRMRFEKPFRPVHKQEDQDVENQTSIRVGLSSTVLSATTPSVFAINRDLNKM